MKKLDKIFDDVGANLNGYHFVECLFLYVPLSLLKLTSFSSIVLILLYFLFIFFIFDFSAVHETIGIISTVFIDFLLLYIWIFSFICTLTIPMFQIDSWGTIFMVILICLHILIFILPLISSSYFYWKDLKIASIRLKNFLLITSIIISLIIVTISIIGLIRLAEIYTVSVSKFYYPLSPYKDNWLVNLIFEK